MYVVQGLNYLALYLCFNRITNGDPFVKARQYDVTVLIYIVGSRTDIKNNEGKTPLDLANEPQSAAFLQHYGTYLHSYII